MSTKKSNRRTNIKDEGGTSRSPMSTELLQSIVKLMAANDLSVVDVRDGEKRVIIKRGPQGVSIPMAAPVAAPVHAVPAPAAAHAEKSAEEVHHLAIKSPMVGTFYSSPSPDAKPFVGVGTHISDDTDVCIIEAMKVFNNIKAECKGTIAKVLVNNGQTVEFGQTLFLVKP